MNVYPQKPPIASEELEAFLRSMRIARIASHNANGTIHLTPVYIKYLDGKFMIGTQAASVKVRNIQRNPQVSLLIDEPTPPYKAVLVYGQAEVDFENVLTRRTEIFEHIGSSPEDALKTAQFLCSTFPSVIVWVTPQRLSSVDYTRSGFLQKKMEEG
jgi:nitroimidazol reductase NimA-like FMN-containing flavoprotein (pyridoxamine 5'-phosphate oxidase superfamily)